MALISLIVIFFCSISASTVYGDFVEKPVSLAAVLGDTAWFDCTGSDNSSDHAYTWLFHQMKPEHITIVYNCQVNPAYSDLYETAETVDGGCRLGVRNINYASAGTYTCQHYLEESSVELIVLNTNSSCSFGPSDVISGEAMTLSCVVNYQGNISPRLDFRSETGEIYTNATINTLPNEVNGRVTFPVFAPTTRAVTANSFFDPPITYTLTFTMPELRVQFPPSNVQIDVAGESCETYYANHTVLTCSGEAWPPATFTWLDLDTGDNVAGSTITLTKLGVNHFACVVENQIRDVLHNASLTVSVNISAGEPSTCPPEPETTQTEPTTTSEPTTTTTPVPTTSFIPITECGSRWRVAPPEAPIVSGWHYMCYINRTDTRWFNTQCVDLLQFLPPDIGDYTSLVSRGGGAGCSYLTGLEDVWAGADVACFRGYQLGLTLAGCPSCSKLVMCIQMPPGLPLDSDSD